MYSNLWYSVSLKLIKYIAAPKTYTLSPSPVSLSLLSLFLFLSLPLPLGEGGNCVFWWSFSPIGWNPACYALHSIIVSTQIHVQRRRLRESIDRVSGRQSRPLPINRQAYSVPWPNALWHLDGNHKLIWWRLVIHGGTDRHSRLITFLHCSNNNFSETVLNCFLEAICEYGIPSRVRTDHGGENVLVWEFMEEQRGSGRSSYIAGQSVHNSCIQRLWRDVYRSVSSSCAAFFMI